MSKTWCESSRSQCFLSIDLLLLSSRFLVFASLAFLWFFQCAFAVTNRMFGVFQVNSEKKISLMSCIENGSSFFPLLNLWMNGASMERIWKQFEIEAIQKFNRCTRSIMFSDEPNRFLNWIFIVFFFKLNRCSIDFYDQYMMYIDINGTNYLNHEIETRQNNGISILDASVQLCPIEKV